jgi:hypothetical protein
MTTTSSPSSRLRRRLVPSGLGGTVRDLPRRTLARGSGEASTGRRDLEIVIATVVAMAAVLFGPLAWAVAVLLLLATVLGTLQVLADVDGPHAERGVPIESLIVPAVAALGAVGAIRLIPIGPGIALAIPLVALLVDRALAIETRLIAAPQGPTAEDRSAALITMLVVALVAFGGVAALVPGGLAGAEQAGTPVAPLAIDSLVALVLGDAAVAGLLGYRAAALRVSDARDAAWAAASYAVAIAIGAAALRAIAIPRLIGPALLMFLFYLWDTLHAAPPSRRRDPRWLWETAILVGLGIAVVAWNLRLDS